MGSISEYSIPFEGLKIGRHAFELKVTSAFFEELTYSIIKGADITVNFTLDKKETMMIGNFEMKGTVQKACDRCNDLMEIPIMVSHQVFYKFGGEVSEDENLISVENSDFSIDISSTIYELLTVALPSRSVHEENQCNPDMLDLLDEYVSFDEKDKEDTDPRWDVLKKIK